MFASPAIDPSALDAFFAEGFDGDPGANRRVDVEDALERKAASEARSVRLWALPLISRYLDVAGKRILDIRSRSGHLSRALLERGADVVAFDPLLPNIVRARGTFGLDNVAFMSISDICGLRGIADGSFDAVVELTVHTLSHLSSPRRHLERVFEVLKPAGLLFIDEKHALMPARTTRFSLFGSEPVHSFHFTEKTLTGYLEITGFEVVECALNPARTSAFRHIQAVARKPAGPDGTPGHGVRPASIDPTSLVAEVAVAQRRLDRIRPVNTTRRKLKKLLRKLPF